MSGIIPIHKSQDVEIYLIDHDDECNCYEDEMVINGKTITYTVICNVCRR